MTILNETARRVQDMLASEYDTITMERVMIGIFFTGVKLSNGAGGVSYTPVKDIPQAVCCPSSAGRIFDPFNWLYLCTVANIVWLDQLLHP